MDTFTPAQLEAFTGLSVGAQRNWDQQGLFLNHAMRTAGGQRRFLRSGVLFVAATRAFAQMGVSLAMAAQIADTYLPEIACQVEGVDWPLTDKQSPFLFVWRSEDTTEDAARAFASGEQPSSACPDGFEWLQLSDLNRIPYFSKSGGTVLIPADVTRKLPQAVKDLFGEAGA